MGLPKMTWHALEKSKILPFRTVSPLKALYPKGLIVIPDPFVYKLKHFNNLTTFFLFN